MPKRIKKRSRKAGLPPGTLVHIGEERTGEVKIKIISYSETELQEKDVKTVEECFAFKDKPGVTWIDVAGIHKVEVVEAIGNYFGLHPLVQEDILNTDQRPKFEDFDDYIYIVMKMLSYNDKNNEVDSEQVSMIIGTNFVISFQEKEEDVFGPLRERIRSGKGRTRKMGPDYLAYSLLDLLVDNYFVLLEKLGEKIESLEQELVTNSTPKTLHTIHNLKREMLFLRKSIWPLREVIGGLEREELPLIKDSTRIYLKDVYDHTVQVIDTVETSRDMLSGMLDIYLTSISNRLNAVMKVLTVIATVFMPLTFIAGVYGMNFRYMPELEWRWGYFAVLAVMVTIGISMFAYFKIKKWI